MKIEPHNGLRNIVLNGFMGTGKTTVGQIIAARLGWPYVDTDELVEQEEGRSIADIINDNGEEAFRRMEHEACLEAAAGRAQVIATGGGALINPESRAALLMDNLLVCLTAEADEIARRLRGDDTRPLLAGEPLARIQTLLAERRRIYEALPHHVDTTDLTPEEVADKVLALWQAK